MAPERGLRGTVAGNTALSLVDGEQGRLLYRGYDIRDLAEHSTYEEVTYLLWHGNLPRRDELQAFDEALRSERGLTKEQLDLLSTFPKDTHPMTVLRTMVSYLAASDPDGEDNSPEANERKGIRLVARFPSIIGAFHRMRNGQDAVLPKPEMNTAAAFLTMLHGEAPTAEEARALDIALLLHVDHEFNASTFSARVTAATLSDLYSAIVSALGALKGPLHGGANQNAIQMLLKIGTPDKAEAYLRAALDRKERIPGFGHPVYRTMDPRAAIMKGMSRTLTAKMGEPQVYETSVRVEELMMELKGLNPNVDFYSASVLYALGMPIDLFTPFFATGRVPGWIGHVMEQYGDNRLIRPLSKYVGERDLKYVPLEQR